MSHHHPYTALRSIAIAGLSAALLFTACTTEPGGGTESAEGIRLTGRVVSSGSAPIAGVVVSLAQNGVSDTTDALGRYVLSKSTTGNAANEVVLDTLRYSKNGQSLARVSVIQWIDSLPDVQVIQRDISGLLNAGGATITRVEAVVSGDGIDSTDPVTADFYYNALTGNYSGFVYFPPASSVQNYQVLINIYGPGDLLAGQSQVVPFNSFAGNITIPTFAAGNAQPIAKAGLDTAVALGATVLLHGAAVDSLGGTITKWEWSIAGAPFVETSSGDTSFSRATHGAYPCVLRVTDNDGNQAIDTVFAMVVSHGSSWTNQTSGITTGLMGVTWTGTQFVAVGSNSAVLTSPDGITWTSRLIDSNQSVSLNNIVWSGQKLFATGYSSSAPYYTSEDGITWSAGELPILVMGPIGMMSVSAADSTVIISTQSSDNQFIARSEDHGATWHVDTLPPTLDPIDGPLVGFNAYTKHAGRIVGVGPNGQTASSNGDSIWTRHTSSASFPRPFGGVYDYTMTSVVSTGTHAVAVGYSGHVMRSVDGITWMTPRIAANIPDQAPGSSLGDLMSVVWTGNTLVAVGNDYTVLSADGGANWAQAQTNTGSLRGVAWSGTRLVAVGSGGKIVTSP